MFDKQIGIFNTTRFTFTEKKINTPVNLVKKIMEDEQGRVILFADSKQFMYDEQQQSFNLNHSIANLPAGYTVSDMAIDHSNSSYWLTGKQGSLLYNIKTKQFDTGRQQSSS